MDPAQSLIGWGNCKSGERRKLLTCRKGTKLKAAVGDSNSKIDERSAQTKQTCGIQ